MSTLRRRALNSSKWTMKDFVNKKGFTGNFFLNFFRLDLDCESPTGAFTQAYCAGIGKRARCCVLPIAGQALLCQPPISA